MYYFNFLTPKHNETENLFNLLWYGISKQAVQCAAKAAARNDAAAACVNAGNYLGFAMMRPDGSRRSLTVTDEFSQGTVK